MVLAGLALANWSSAQGYAMDQMARRWIGSFASAHSLRFMAASQQSDPSNYRAGVDAGHPLLFAFQRQRPGTIRRGRWATKAV